MPYYLLTTYMPNRVVAMRKINVTIRVRWPNGLNESARKGQDV